MGDSKVKHLEIQFDRESATYLPGDQVSGKVLVKFSKPKQFKGIRIVAKGESAVQWSEKKDEKNGDGDEEQLVLSGHEEYFSTKYYLLGSASGSPLTLPAGQLAYPFKFQLPMNIPNSFEHDLGFVRYMVSVFVDGPWNTEHEVKATFQVVSTYDLNERPGAALAIEEKVIKSFCCFCICIRGKLFATISVPASGFAPGQTIPVTVYCENESTVDVTKIKVYLMKKIKFHAKSPQWETKEAELVAASEKCKKPFVNNSEEYVTLNLRVPPLPPSGLDFCGLIDLEYLLKVNISFSGFHCSIEREFPVLVGTVPLYSFSNFSAIPALPTAPHFEQPNFQTPIPFDGMAPPASAPENMHQHQQQQQQHFFVYMQPGTYLQQSSPYNPNAINQQNSPPPPYSANVQKR